MKKINLKIIVLLLGIFFLIFCLAKDTGADDSITGLTKEEQDQYNETQKKIKGLEEKAKAYQQIIEIKQKQQRTLNNQVSIIEAEINQMEAEIEINKGKIGDLNNQINQLRTEIKEKEDTIISQKKILGGLIQMYYEYNKESALTAFFGNESLSRAMSQSDRLSQTGDKIREILNTIQSLKNKLEDEKNSLENKKDELTDTSFELEDRSSKLESDKGQKEVLISQTQGEESRYGQLLARVDAQKQELLGDIDELYASNTAEINTLIAGLSKPVSGLSSTSWYYSQKDSRWGNSRIGQSNSLVKDYGCALTSVAMIFTYYGETATPGNLARQKIFYWDLIAWPDGDNVELVKNTNHGGVNWNEIDRELDKGNPVIVFIKAKSSAGHYVVIHHKVGNDYVVHDPYWGSNIYLSSSIKLLSALYKTSISKSSIDQMVLYKK